MPKISEADLLTDLQRVASELGRAPSFEDIRKYGKYSPVTFQRRFGDWNHVKHLVGWRHPSETIQDYRPTIADAAWVAGLIDGEGCFRLQHPSPNSPSRSFSPVFSISLRKDDKPCLDELIRIIGTSVVYHIDNRNGQGANAMPAYKIFIRDMPALAFRLMPLLEIAPLRSKKLRELKLFKRALGILMQKASSGRSNQRYTDDERRTLADICAALSELKEYESDEQAILTKYNL